MAEPFKVVFLWHFHQPSYLDFDSGRYRMPWVRLHAVKDYYAFARLLGRHPSVRATFNVTPVLLEQVLDIAGRRPDDDFSELTRRPADQLDEAARLYLARNFFALNWETMLFPFPRYRQLLEKRGRVSDTEVLERRAGDFSIAELRDLQVLFNLAWVDPGLRREDELPRELERKGRDFTEAEKLGLLDYHYQLAGRVIPEWRRLQDSGQVEFSVSPYYHPILPLLLKGPHPLPEDASLQLKEARLLFRAVFGRDPAGCWPSEGAVSPAALDRLAAAGFRWAASDEEVLGRSLGPAFRRELIYCSHEYRGPSGSIRMLFRDRDLSDRIGFVYRFQAADRAAADFSAGLERARSAAGPGAAVPVILDGENAWEYYPENGRPFLEALYRSLESNPAFPTATVSDYLDASTPVLLERIHSGSWINGDFHIWSGHPAADRAWQALADARSGVDLAAAGPELRRSLLAAEGSDWFWWYSPEHFSGRDEEFDAAFRGLLRNAYRLGGRPVPADLEQPIKCGQEEVHFPRNPVTAVLDGRETSYYEWLGAGHFLRHLAGGAMHGPPEAVTEFLFGWDREHLYLRIEPGPLLR